MLRAVVELLVVIIVGYFIREVMGIIMGALNPTKSQRSSTGSPSAQRPPAPPPASELKKDPVCGTFVSTSTALQKTSGGTTYYFCSADCRDKFRG